MSKKKTLNIRYGEVVLFVMSMVNLLYMHYYVFYNQCMEVPMFVFSPVLNVLSILIDISIFFLIFYSLSLRRFDLGLWLTYLFTLLWSFSNTFYCRFFSHYLSLSAIGQAGSLTEGLVIKSMVGGFQYWDFFYVCSFICVLFYCCFSHHRLRKVVLHTNLARLLLSLICFPIFAGATIYTAYHFIKPSTRNNTELYFSNLALFTIGSESGRRAVPNLYMFHDGCIRSICSEEYGNLFPVVLSDEERSQIRDYYINRNLRISDRAITDSTKIKNVVFILLESFLSISSDLVIDGKRITPFLDSLKHSKDVYYNGHVRSNITIGESGDGQFIYLTGLLPTKSQLVLAEASDNVLPALPLVLKTNRGIANSEIIIPTVPKVWKQDEMNIAYGFSKLYCYYDVYNTTENTIFLCLNDEEIFNLAISSLSKVSKPFFSLILSASTHMPYNSQIDKEFLLEDSHYSDEFLNYLNACHYTDVNLKRFFDKLKEINLFDETLFFIMADHHAHTDALNMSGKISADIPLYIINGGFEKSEAYDGPCNQLDVYTTLLDILNLQCKWRGLGHTLLRKDYSNSVTPETYSISEQIVFGDYFRDENSVGNPF